MDLAKKHDIDEAKKMPKILATSEDNDLMTDRNRSMDASYF
jgi:hypothetical protein